MVQAELLGSNKQNGQLLSIRLRIRDPNEIKAFRAFLKDEPDVQRCPKCHTTPEIPDEMLSMDIESPLGSGTGLQMARPNIYCQNCGQILVHNVMDYSAFPSVLSFITSLRNRYVQMKQQQRKVR